MSKFDWQCFSLLKVYCISSSLRPNSFLRCKIRAHLKNEWCLKVDEIRQNHLILLLFLDSLTFFLEHFFLSLPDYSYPSSEFWLNYHFQEVFLNLPTTTLRLCVYPCCVSPQHPILHSHNFLILYSSGLYGFLSPSQGASLVAQTIKHLPAMWETQV